MAGLPCADLAAPDKYCWYADSSIGSLSVSTTAHCWERASTIRMTDCEACKEILPLRASGYSNTDGFADKAEQT